jgi:hypothetical protein
MGKLIKNEEFNSFLIGTVLGDSSLCGRKNKYLFMGHSESQLEYLKWKEQIIRENLSVGTNFKEGISMTSPSGNRQKFYKIFTTSHHKLTSIYKITHDANGKKIVTQEALEKLTPFGIAVLFMDDGCKEIIWNRNKTKKRIKCFKISLGGFSVQEVKSIGDILLYKYEIDYKVYLEHGKYPCLKITTEENKKRFIELITPYLIDSMKYKIQIQE